MKIISVVGARPNFIKIALIIRAMKKSNKRLWTLDKVFSALTCFFSYNVHILNKIMAKKMNSSIIGERELRVIEQISRDKNLTHILLSQEMESWQTLLS